MSHEHRYDSSAHYNVVAHTIEEETQMTAHDSGPGDSNDPEPTDPTTELIRRFQRGEASALHELLDLHRRWIQREVSQNLSGIVRQMDDTGDVVNEVMLRILKMKELRFTCGGEFRSLVARVVQSTLYSLAAKYGAEKRDRKRDQHWTTEGLGFDRNAHAHTGNPESRAARKETSEMLRVAIAMLDLPTQRLIHLRLERGMTWSDIGSEIGVPEDTARIRFDRALKRLANLTVKIRTGRLGSALDLGSRPGEDEDGEDRRDRDREDDDEDGGSPRVAARARPPRR